MAKKRQLGQSQYETLAAFRYALRRFIRFSEQAAQDAGITPQQYQALLAVKGFPGGRTISVGELAERLQLRHHSVVGLVDRLVAEKLVVRGESAEDRRRVLIQTTRRGEDFLEKLATVHHAQLRRIGPEISQLLERLGERAE
jgi:DNA-binding MarR family transcriptional regulator